MNAFTVIDRAELARVEGGVMVPDGYCGTPVPPGRPPIPVLNVPSFDQNQVFWTVTGGNILY
jgi:hypothetical protein